MGELEVDIFWGPAGPRGLPIFWIVRGETTPLSFRFGSDHPRSARRLRRGLPTCKTSPATTVSLT